MKRLSLLLFLGFTLSTAFFGCLSGPGVEPPRAGITDGKGQAGAEGSSLDDNAPVLTGAGGSGEQAAAGAAEPTTATGGVAGADSITMDASVTDGGAPPMDGGTTADSAVVTPDAASDDDAGAEQ